MVNVDSFVVTILDPCDECGAESGERCRVDCTGYSTELGELS
jgi:hypothetical protein